MVRQRRRWWQWWWSRRRVVSFALWHHSNGGLRTMQYTVIVNAATFRLSTACQNIAPFYPINHRLLNRLTTVCLWSDRTTCTALVGPQSVLSFYRQSVWSVSIEFSDKVVRTSFANSSAFEYTTRIATPWCAEIAVTRRISAGGSDSTARNRT